MRPEEGDPRGDGGQRGRAQPQQRHREQKVAGVVDQDDRDRGGECVQEHSEQEEQDGAHQDFEGHPAERLPFQRGLPSRHEGEGHPGQEREQGRGAAAHQFVEGVGGGTVQQADGGHAQVDSEHAEHGEHPGNVDADQSSRLRPRRTAQVWCGLWMRHVDQGRGSRVDSR